MGIIFVAGVYGVGKSTLCETLSNTLCIPAYSAGDLISKVNGEKYGANKAVSNKINNQNILINELNEILQYHSTILLAGHFCIFDKSNCVNELPKSVFEQMQIEQILLLERDVEKIVHFLNVRDNKLYTHEQIKRLLTAERISAEEVANAIDCPLHIHKMIFDKTDLEICISIIKEEYKNENFIRY